MDDPCAQRFKFEKEDPNRLFRLILDRFLMVNTAGAHLDYQNRIQAKRRLVMRQHSVSLLWTHAAETSFLGPPSLSKGPGTYI